MVATLRAIGLACGVSPTTVGLALRGSPRIPEATRLRVLEMARRLGRKPESRPVSTVAVEVVVDRWSEDLGPVLEGILETVRRPVAQSLGLAPGLHLLPVTSHDLLTELATIPPPRILVVIARWGDRDLEPLHAAGHSLVVTGRHSSVFDCVEPHPAAALDRLIDRLTAGGRRAVALVVTAAQMRDNDPSMHQWRRRMNEEGLLARSPLLVVPDDSLEQGLEQAVPIRQSGAGAALCLAGDATAAGLVRELRRLQVLVPAQIAVAGFGDAPLGRFSDPEITTVALPWREMGRAAVEVAMRRLRHRLGPRVHRVVDARLVGRRSA